VVPNGVESMGNWERDKGPRIISLVLAVFNCIWFWSAQLSKFCMKSFMLELLALGCKTSDRVVSSTYLCTRHPVAR